MDPGVYDCLSFCGILQKCKRPVRIWLTHCISSSCIKMFVLVMWSHLSICDRQTNKKASQQNEWSRGLLGFLGWAVVPNWSPVFVYGQQPGDWSRGPAALLTGSRLCLQLLAAVPFTCLFVFLSLFGLDISCVNSKKQYLFRKGIPSQNCLNAPQCEFIFSQQQAITTYL